MGLWQQIVEDTVLQQSVLVIITGFQYLHVTAHGTANGFWHKEKNRVATTRMGFVTEKALSL
jgi:hypothetical protein